MLVLNILLYLASFFFIWVGSGLIVSSIEHFSKRLRLSSFSVSFIVLGLLTSTPELAVGLQSVADGDPEIFVGNLLGGIPVLFLLVIPLLAVLGNGIKIKHELTHRNLIAALGIILAPSVIILDKKVSFPEGILLMMLYIILVILIQRHKGVLDTLHSEVLNTHAYSYKDVLKVILGIIIVFITSAVIVDKTLYFADILSLSPFYISLIAVSLGTNMPELSIAIRSILSGNKDVAFGDYLGSAAANTVLFGFFTLLNKGEVLTVNSFFITFSFIFSALVLFYTFSRTERSISRAEGIVLFIIYLLFVIVELVKT